MQSQHSVKRLPNGRFIKIVLYLQKKAYSTEQTLEYALDIISNAHYIFKEWTIDEKQTILELAFGKCMRLDLLKKDLPNSPNTSLYQAFQLADSQKVKKLEMTSIELVSKKQCTDILPS